MVDVPIVMTEDLPPATGDLRQFCLTAMRNGLGVWSQHVMAWYSREDFRFFLTESPNGFVGR
ncbi:hypothetical protein J2T09_005570, partial [Neorhizobium huautlense]|nr:hypothetical protein [Neorhizobium huautlense]